MPGASEQYGTNFIEVAWQPNLFNVPLGTFHSVDLIGACRHGIAIVLTPRSTSHATSRRSKGALKRVNPNGCQLSQFGTYLSVGYRRMPMLRLHALQTGIVLVLTACGGNVENDGTHGTHGTFGDSTGGQATSGQPGADTTQSSGGAGGAVTGGITCITQEQMDEIYQSACAGSTVITGQYYDLKEFVVDTSGSMSDIAPNSGQRSKWEVTRDALTSAMGSVPSSTAAGLLLYPNQATIPNTGGAHPLGDCLNTDAAVPPGLLGNGSAQFDAIVNALSTAIPQGGTPTEDAYAYAVNYHVIPALSTYQGDRMVVLITDGSPTISLGCSGAGQSSQPVDSQPIIQAISDAWTNFRSKPWS